MNILERLVRFIGRRKSPPTLKREFALAAFAVWIAVTIRIFAFGTPEWAAAQGVNYATVTSTVFLFIAAAIGLQTWQNQQDKGPASPEPPAGPVPTEDQIEETGEGH